MDKLVVCIKDTIKEEMKEQARAFAEKIDVPIGSEMGEELTVLFAEDGIWLVGYGLSYRGDFEAMLRRISGGRLQHEMLAKAAKSPLEIKRAVDATAGMGEDSLLLAAAGYEVVLCEQNPVIALLLKDTLARAKMHPQLKDIVERMQLFEGDSITYLKKVEKVDLVYLDPMFPARQKSGLIHKKLQLIQKLEPPCAKEEALFEAAIMAGPSKIVVKRPLKSPYLAEKKPNYSLQGKAIRYDCYVYTKRDEA